MPIKNFRGQTLGESSTIRISPWYKKSFFGQLQKPEICKDGILVTFCLGRRRVLIGWYWMWEALANLVHDPIVKPAAGKEERVFG